MIVRALPLLKNSTSHFLKGLRTSSPMQMLKWNAQSILNQTSFLSTINLKELLINYQMPILTIMRRQLEEGESELNRAILNVSTFRRKKTKLKKAKKRQKRKKLRRLSDRKRKKLNLL